MRTMLRGIVLATVTSLLLAMAMMPALAQTDPYGEAEPTTGEAEGPATAEAGQEVTFVADEFAVGAEVLVQVGGVVVTTGTVVANAQGVATAAIEIPCGTPEGDATVSFTGEGETGGERVVTTNFTVVGATAACPAGAVDEGGLAATGINLSNGVLLALGLLVIGGGAVAAGRRNRTDEVTPIDA